MDEKIEARQVRSFRTAWSVWVVIWQ